MSLRRSTALGGIALLVVLDAVLIVLAWEHTYADGVVGQSQSSDESATPEAAGVPSPDTKDPGTEDPGAEAPDAEAPEAEIAELSLLNGLLVRAPRTSCAESSDPVTVQTSADLGVTAESATPAELAEVASIEIVAPGSAVIVGADEDCGRLDLVTTDGGSTWREANRVGASWGLVPSGGTGEVVTPGGEVEPPCPMSAITGFSSEVARGSCADGLVVSTDDGGASWQRGATLSGALAIAWSTPVNAYALIEVDRCGLAVRASLDGGATFDRARCTGLEARDAAPGIAASGGTVVVMSGDRRAVSTDAGTAFERG